MRTDFFQSALPKLPIPRVADSVRRYLGALYPIVDAGTYEASLSHAQDFMDGDAAHLQAELTARDAAKYSSFISDPWFEMYLSDRRSLLLNSNPQLTFNDDPLRSGPGSQIPRAASLLYASAEFHQELKSKRLAPDVYHTSGSAPWWFNSVLPTFPPTPAYYASAIGGSVSFSMC